MPPSGPVFDVCAYGAVGDGSRDDTAAIQRAVDAQHDTAKGYVRVGGGKTYRVGTLVLKDDVTLWVEGGATLKGIRDANAYPALIPPDYRAQKVFTKSMIYAGGAKRVSIQGNGVFDASGEGVQGKETARWNTFRFVNCEDVRVSGVTLTNSCVWPQLYSRTRRLVIDGVKVRFTDQINTDGLDIDGCEQVEIKNCEIDSEDDAIVLKTLSRDHPNRDIFIHDNRVTSRRASGLKIGTETHGACEDIRFRNNVVRNCGGRAGGAIVVLAVDGGCVRRVSFEDIDIDSCYNAIAVRLGSRNRTYSGQPDGPVTNSVMEDLSFKRIRATNIYRKFECWVSGVPGCRVRKVSFEDVRIQSTANGSAEDRRVDPQESERLYPDPDMFDPLPAFACYLRHVENVRLKDCVFDCCETEGRYAFVLDDVCGFFRLDAVDARKGGVDQRRQPLSYPVVETRDAATGRYRLRTL